MKPKKTHIIAAVVHIAAALIVSSCDWRFGGSDEGRPGTPPTPAPEQPTGTLPVEVALGAAGHVWTPKLGGCTWMPTVNLLEAAASVFDEYPRPVLVDIKAPSTGFGYRFDLDEWDQRESSYDWYSWIGGDRGARAEDILQVCEASGNAEFIFHVPSPRNRLENPWDNGRFDEGEGYLWQTPAYYAAMVQYLFGTAGAPAEYESLPMTLDFAGQAASFNWANLRARRGRAEPYPVVAVIIGQEPYNIEGWANDGAAWGAVVEETRQAIRARGLSMPLGLHVRDSGPPSDSDRSWFLPMMQAVDWDDFEYLDLHHYYLFNNEPDAFKRVFPVSVNPNGFQNDWPSAPPPDQWHADYTRFLWIIEDTRYALNEFGYDANPNGWKLGFGEHGHAVVSSFAYNDMGAGLHWASWLAEGMRQDTGWDANWVLFEQGSSHAQIQIRSNITRTPGFYVYQMAMEFYGLVYRELEYEEEMGTVPTAGGGALQYPYLVLRCFQEPSGDRLHIFAINLSEGRSYQLEGFAGRTASSWKRLSAPSYDAMNYFLDENWAPPTVYTVDAECPAPGDPIIVPPISVNHIILD